MTAVIPYTLNASDALVEPGRPGRITARLQRTWPLMPALGRAGARLTYAPVAGPAAPHSVTTGSGGWVELELAPGRYTLWADGAEPTCVTVAEVARERPLLVTDIDRTISDHSNAAALLLPNERLRPLPGAVEALRRLAERHAIVYLTARNLRFSAKTKAWLILRGLPVGPVLFRRAFWFRQSSAAFKLRTMAELARVWPVRAGVGDRPGDAAAYAAAGAKPILIGTNGAGGLPDGTVRADSWKAVEQLLAAPPAVRSNG
jgi:hypothetical protein